MKKVILKLADGTEYNVKPFTREEPKITTDILLLPKDIKALKSGYMVKFTDMENSVAVCVRFAVEKSVG